VRRWAEDAAEPLAPASRLSAHNQGAFAMVEERITEVETPSGNTHTHTTVVSDAARSGGGAMWLIVLLLIVVAAVAFWFLSGMSQSEIAENNAVTEAAGEVGEAANEVGEAAQQAGDAAQDAATR
jgi:hypothetical protein